MAIKLRVHPRSTIKAKVKPTFPINVEGEGGIEVVKEDGLWKIRPEAGTIGDVSGPGAGSDATGHLAYFLTPFEIAPGAALYSQVEPLLTISDLTTGTLVKSGDGPDVYVVRTMAAPAAGFTITNPAGIAGNPTFVLANDLAALEGMSGTGLVVRTAAETYAQRTITGTANEITSTNGDGVSGNPTLSLPSSLTFTGKTVTGGTFNGIAIDTTSTGVTQSPNDNSTKLATTAYVDGISNAGKWTLLATLTASNSATLSDTTHLTSTYNAYELVFDNILPTTNGVTLELQVQSGGSFQNSSYQSQTSAFGNAAVYSNPTAFVQLSGATAVANSNGGVSGRLLIHNPSQTTTTKSIDGNSGHYDGTRMESVLFSGFWNGGNGAVTGFQIFFSTGNISSGTVRLYGRL